MKEVYTFYSGKIIPEIIPLKLWRVLHISITLGGTTINVYKLNFETREAVRLALRTDLLPGPNLNLQ